MKKRTDDAPTTGGGQVLSLSLFVMLLAFFIVLNSLSTFDSEKVKPVVESLEDTFTSKIQGDKKNSSPIEDPEKSYGKGDSLDRIEALFRSQIPSASFEKSDRYGTMTVRMDFKGFSAAVMNVTQENLDNPDPEIKSSDTLFLSMLVAMVETGSTGRQYKMDMLLNLEENPSIMQNRSPKKLDEEMRKMGAIAQKLEKEGLPEMLMSIGLKKGKSGIVELLFRPYEQFIPLAEKGTQ